MPKRTDIESILIIGAGPIIIGQACEFDYSGTQACRALRLEGYRTILVNSNPATIMTDPGMADATYIEPVTPEFVSKIIEKERPDALLPTMGGQTALNTAMAVADHGILEKFGVEMIGADRSAIEKAEDREQFRQAMANIGLECPVSLTAHTLEEARVALTEIGLPLIIRPSFTLGGTGSGVAYNKEEFEHIVANGLDASPTSEVLIEQSVLGWKEYEMEVVRDRNDNCIIVCSIENVDPMGVHTGDSITIAPALTLTDKEYQVMRNASIAVLREIGVETGGSNVQFAIDPQSGRLVVIEMNPRVSRSSALASKATGFPIAKVAARLAVGYTLDELDNEITGVTPASFEPTIDYVVTKIPRFTFEKFPGADRSLTTSMKSVGEVMSIGRSFPESLQKALRSMEIGLNGLNEVLITGAESSEKLKSTGARDAITAALAEQSPERLLVIAQALRANFDIKDIHRITGYDPWFIEQIDLIVQSEETIKQYGIPNSRNGLLELKQLGFSDSRLAQLSKTSEQEIALRRKSQNIHPVFKRVDTCAGEFQSKTPYLYSTYESDCWWPTQTQPRSESEAQPSKKSKIIVLGGGPNRIGQGIEFDYCCCHAAYALTEAGHETIMVNCNPETVSTDYDTSDRLYFEPLTVEDVLEIVATEQSNGSLLGIIVQFGGQTPLKLAQGLERAGVPILGTSPNAIDLAEDRQRFQQLLSRLELRQPSNGIASSVNEATQIARQIGYPIVIRPSYVLGGRAMEIVQDPVALERYMKLAVQVSGSSPVLIDAYLRDAIEVDVDALCDGEKVFVAGIMEHIEEAGVHSGDSACVLPPHTLPVSVIEDIRRQTEALALALNVIGLMNVQYAVKNSDVYILEVNPRASRTVPFVAKATGKPIASIAAKIMAGSKIDDLVTVDDHRATKNTRVAVKEAVFPFARFPGVDIVLGPEMRSTGEVMGIDKDFAKAFAKSQLAGGIQLPKAGRVFISVKDDDKKAMVNPARKLCELGYQITATHGTAKFLSMSGINCKVINKVMEGSPHIVDAIKNGDIALVVNTTAGSQAISDSFSLRRAALTEHIPYYTTIAGALAAIQAMETLIADNLEVTPIQTYS